MRSREGLLYSPIVHTLIGLVVGIGGRSMVTDCSTRIRLKADTPRT